MLVYGVSISAVKEYLRLANGRARSALIKANNSASEKGRSSLTCLTYSDKHNRKAFPNRDPKVYMEKVYDMPPIREIRCGRFHSSICATESALVIVRNGSISSDLSLRR